ncbi:ATPase [Anaerovorax odorimutans]|uniref:ATPase n=1 Tax=Anaerovorax odorimutans TaxID=109327 RepID=A0ABT1RLE4_9FIRM|nr:ATPase [Anaerovorax odorimutans]MCQ4636010.1 ATPase [Anaerovorax odorimutans]
MNGKIRHIYPGGNTPEGFFSYYQYILGQQEANRIICLKGGPGVGKSTFIRKIGEHFIEKGEDVDFMWCSSDAASLDGIVLKQKKIAIIDATSPHVVDPVNPGAVDSIVHLGEFWNGEALKKCKSHVMESNHKIKHWFGYGYNYLEAAGALADALATAYEDAIEDGELYKIAAGIVGDELSHKEIALNPGQMKKYFASAITPEGVQHHLESLIEGYDKLYMITGPVGLSNARLLNIVAESAIYRGMDVEAFYCPMKPREKLEHLLIPQMKTAFLSLNQYHDLEPWEREEEIHLIDMNDIISWSRLEELKPMLADCSRRMSELIKEATKCIVRAKKEHDRLESYYIPNMDFKKIDALRDEIIGKIEKNVL